jgi:6-phosphogluconolactonase/glucosamine-6-phosphate isomerase/deaminase
MYHDAITNIDDFESTTREAAQVIVNAIRKFKPTTEKPTFNMGMAAGIVPKGIYKHLTQMFKDGVVDFKVFDYINHLEILFF